MVTCPCVISDMEHHLTPPIERYPVSQEKVLALREKFEFDGINVSSAISELATNFDEFGNVLMRIVPEGGDRNLRRSGPGNYGVRRCGERGCEKERRTRRGSIAMKSDPLWDGRWVSEERAGDGEMEEEPHEEGERESWL
ncbi:hypothetical protein Tco_0960292 [Tanacetum coccineum]